MTCNARTKWQLIRSWLRCLMPTREAAYLEINGQKPTTTLSDNEHGGAWLRLLALDCIHGAFVLCGGAMSILACYLTPQT